MDSKHFSTRRKFHLKIAVGALAISALAVGATLPHATHAAFDPAPTTHVIAAHAHLLPMYLHHADGNASETAQAILV
jgi:hypothetical protein